MIVYDENMKLRVFGIELSSGTCKNEELLGEWQCKCTDFKKLYEIIEKSKWHEVTCLG